MSRAKRGRPSIKYDSFVETWEQLMADERASINAVQNTLGGDKGTIKGYIERYEREQAGKELSIIKGIELPEAVQQAIAAIKVKEIEALERENQQLKARMDGYLADLQKAEEATIALKVVLDEVKAEFEIKQNKLERQLAVAESRASDADKRENQMAEQYQKLSEQVNHYKQESAVAKKEVEMLREQTKMV